MAIKGVSGRDNKINSADLDNNQATATVKAPSLSKISGIKIDGIEDKHAVEISDIEAGFRAQPHITTDQKDAGGYTAYTMIGITIYSKVSVGGYADDAIFYKQMLFLIK